MVVYKLLAEEATRKSMVANEELDRIRQTLGQELVAEQAEQMNFIRANCSGRGDGRGGMKPRRRKRFFQLKGDAAASSNSVREGTLERQDTDHHRQPGESTEVASKTEGGEGCLHTASQALAWCEGVTVFGAGVVCAVARRLPPLGAACRAGVATGVFASASAYCASPLPLAMACEGGEDVPRRRNLDSIRSGSQERNWEQDRTAFEMMEGTAKLAKYVVSLAFFQ